MNRSNPTTPSAILEAKDTTELSPEIRASLTQDETLQETWALHQMALRFGESVRTKRSEQPISALSSQGYLQRIEARLAQRKQQQSQKTWWLRVYQVAGSGVVVAASAMLLWWTPQKIAQDIALSSEPLNRSIQPRTPTAIAKKDNLDLWLQRLDGSALSEIELNETPSRSDDPLAAFVDSDGLAPISQTIPAALEGVSILSEEE
ncbi:hypothetical protein L6R29_14260 [Myxococcota bacterium]|nr:hypothetical protein [Myxococcota bacterium]